MLTVGFYLACWPFDDFAEMGPFGEVFEVEADVVCLCQVVEVAGVEFEEVHGVHGAYGSHVG